MTTGFFLTFFVPVTLANIIVSRRSLLVPHSHGFYRFFVFELIVILFLMNVSLWFEDPFSPIHLVSWLLLLGSIGPVLSGYSALRRRGKPTQDRALETNLAFENTSRLVTTGIYRHIRHPMYASLLMLCWGIFLKAPSLTGCALGVGTTCFLLLTAKAEERENAIRFGGEYLEYRRRTRMFIPFVL